MKRPLTVADILNSVEFELMQHTLLQDDVGDGIQRLRAYLANIRSEVLGDGKSPSVNAAIDLQLNTAAMLLTLLQVIDQRFAALQQDFRRAAFAQQHTSPASGAAQTESAQVDNDQSSHPWRNVAAALSLPAAHTAMDFDDAARSTDALNEFITDEPPLLEMDVRQSQTPLLGGVINRARRELHELVLFYVNKVVRQQADVNRTYGSLLQELIAANQAQAQEVQELRRQVLQLTAQQLTTTAQSHSNLAPES